MRTHGGLDAGHTQSKASQPSQTKRLQTVLKAMNVLGDWPDDIEEQADDSLLVTVGMAPAWPPLLGCGLYTYACVCVCARVRVCVCVCVCACVCAYSLERFAAHAGVLPRTGRLGRPDAIFV